MKRLGAVSALVLLVSCSQPIRHTYNCSNIVDSPDPRVVESNKERDIETRSVKRIAYACRDVCKSEINRLSLEDQAYKQFIKKYDREPRQLFLETLEYDRFQCIEASD